MNILLIAGHGAGDSGAVAFGRQEAELTREVVTLLQKELLKYKCDCRVYNMTLSAYHEMIALGKNYDFTPYDYVLEVHFNAFSSDSGNGKVKGSEIYVTTSEPNISVEGKILAKLATVGFTNRGVKRTNFSVIAKARGQGVSSALLEICFIDDADDMKIYLNNREKIASSIALAIAEEYRLERKEDNMFSDIDNHWAKADIEKVAKLGIMNGYTDGTFKPEKLITRAELATVAGRLLTK